MGRLSSQNAIQALLEVGRTTFRPSLRNSDLPRPSLEVMQMAGVRSKIYAVAWIFEINIGRGIRHGERIGVDGLRGLEAGHAKLKWELYVSCDGQPYSQ